MLRIVLGTLAALALSLGVLAALVVWAAARAGVFAEDDTVDPETDRLNERLVDWPQVVIRES